MSFHVFSFGKGKEMVTDSCGIPIDPSQININEHRTESLKIGDKVKWTSARCVSDGYGLCWNGGQGRVFDITDRHVYVCTVGVIHSGIKGFRKSSLVSLGLEKIDEFNFDQENVKHYGGIQDIFDDPWISDYEKYELCDFGEAGNYLRYKTAPTEGACHTYHYIDSSDRYDYFLPFYGGKPSLIDLFDRKKRPSGYHFTPMTQFDL